MQAAFTNSVTSLEGAQKRSKKARVKIGLKIAAISVSILIMGLMSVTLVLVAFISGGWNAAGVPIGVAVVFSILSFFLIKAILNIRKYGYSEKPTAGYVREVKPTNIGIPKGPHYIAINPTTNLIYVACNESDVIIAVDGSTNRVVKVIDINRPGQIVINPSTNRLYVITGWTKWGHKITPWSGSGKQISVIDITNGKLIESISKDETFCRIDVNPDTNMIYATSPSARVLYMIDGNTNKVTNRIDVGNDKVKPTGLAVNPMTNAIYVAYDNSNAVSMINGHTNSIEGYFSMPGIPAAADGYTADIYVNHKANMLYVLGRSTLSGNYGEPHEKDTFYMIDLSSQNLKEVLWSRAGMWEQVYLANGGHENLAVNTISNKIYLTNNYKRELLVIDSTNCKILDAIHISKKTDYVAVNAVTDRVYVTDSNHLQIHMI